ncbi:hypothetical protein COV42_02015 [Candidatus Campbellbacteria bacterium CG11_big_fil_rev_8_21_14_0_20_44_21]|uniref:Uncharacterized protein n=1 Tax=Candidatus Campbellbacteria bacterium CG22_combo_CG10-13_8_21_14_all_43_18 TaxID=1974530 RepID=A0A2H0DW02_9BACT|nr:MAG: hypothetical protein COW82_02550 [Candidatus Campbellbacteria bacterium CG22_combo_CG10-13_8_21_14_all_43_18]PIR24203.1 MAG: hypothetical protein COV42_02015 [Candidatus Campbellbacteria bacterium CG11_big_fil_rev_8_21_14_0_20_44_21]
MSPLSVSKRPGTKPSFHIIVPKKLFPLRTERNLIKRRLRAALADIFGKKFPQETIIVYAGKKILHKKIEELKKELLKRL